MGLNIKKESFTFECAHFRHFPDEVISALDCISNFVVAADSKTLKIFLINEDDYEDVSNIQIEKY